MHTPTGDRADQHQEHPAPGACDRGALIVFIYIYIYIHVIMIVMTIIITMNIILLLIMINNIDDKHICIYSNIYIYV